uniref:Ig-like domain-containing protein n=1 Tax=Amphimedon queenslandica TaxID=400682 RepID=A0A1X7UAP3_AMPQE
MAPSSSSILLIKLLLLLQLRSVHLLGQEPPSILPSNGVQLYLAYVDRVIPNYSMIYASQFYDQDQNNDIEDITDALWCQSANNGTNIGVWHYPNGTEVPLFHEPFDNHTVPQPVFSKRFSGQIALARSGGLSGYEGLYKCIIPDENGVNQTLVVGAYTDTGYSKN